MRERQLRRKSAQVSKRREDRIRTAPWKLLLWTALAGLVFGLIGFGEIAEDILRVARNSLHPHKRQRRHRPRPDRRPVASSDSAIGPGHGYQDAAGRPAQCQRRQTHLLGHQLLVRLRHHADDAALADALQRAGRVTLFSRSTGRTAGHSRAHRWPIPLPMFTRHAKLAVATSYYNYQNAVWRVPCRAKVGGKTVPSFAAVAGQRSGPADATFPARLFHRGRQHSGLFGADVLNGRVAAKELAGKDVLVGTGSEMLNDNFFVPGYGRAFGVQVHALGAETLKQGRPVDLGWLGAFLLGIAAAALGATAQTRGSRSLQCSQRAITALLTVPVFLEARLIFADITPALFVLLVVGGVLTWRRFRARGLVNPVSNLPNLNALAGEQGRAATGADRGPDLELRGNRRHPAGEQRAAARRPDRFAPHGRRSEPYALSRRRRHFRLVRRASRAVRQPSRCALCLVPKSGASRWPFARPRQSLSASRSGAAVRSPTASPAHSSPQKKPRTTASSGNITIPDSLQDASWKLSILSQLDAAIDRGEVWVAYQPKLDLRSRQIIGAEALARWTHPEKGPIAASEFVAAAEQHNRIGKLTDFVLEKAVAAAAPDQQARA